MRLLRKVKPLPVIPQPKPVEPKRQVVSAPASAHVCGCCKQAFSTEADYAMHRCQSRFGFRPTEPGFPY